VQAAVNEMRGFPLGGPDKRIRMDFADVDNMPPPRGYQGSDYDPNIARQAVHPGLSKVLDTFFQKLQIEIKVRSERLELITLTQMNRLQIIYKIVYVNKETRFFLQADQSDFLPLSCLWDERKKTFLARL
jgi:hypothetical protein